MTAVLSTLFNGSSISSNPALVILTDSLLQPGLLLLNQISSSALNRDEQVLLIALEQAPIKLLPLASSYNSNKLNLIDCVSIPPFASTSTTKLDPGTIDLDSHDGFTELVRMTCETIAKQKKSGGKITVILDSIDILAEHGVDKVFKFIKRTLKSLVGCSGSRLIVLHHASFPSPPSISPSPSLLSTLLSPSLSPSTIHLTLHPSPLLELFSREYGLSIPLFVNSAQSLDLRLNSFLDSFNSRIWGNPFLRPSTSTTEDERIPIDLLSQDALEEGGGCVVEYSARGVVFGSGIMGKKGEVKKIIQRGLEGLKKVGEGVAAVGLNEILKAEKMARVNVVLPSETSNLKQEEPALPFNLSLTDSQKSAREAVVLPYLPKEDGSVDYTPDEGDDMDEDDPDELMD